MKRFPLLLMFSFICLLSCKKDELIINPPQDELILSPTTKKLSNEDFTSHFVSFSADSSSITFNSSIASAYNIAAGDILLSTYGEGFLKKVTTIQQSGDNIIYNTENAAITEAIEKGEGNFSRSLDLGSAIITSRKGVTPRGVNYKGNKRTTSALDVDITLYDIDGNDATDYDQIKLVGSLSIDPSISGDIEISNYSLRTCTFDFTFDEHLDLTLEIPLAAAQAQILGELKTTLAQIVFPTFTPGALPITITPVLTIEAGAKLTVAGKLTTGITEDFTFTTGMNYIGGNEWETYADPSADFGFIPPNLEAGVEAKIFVKPELKFKIYGVVSPYVNAELYAKFRANTSETPWWKLSGGLDGTLGIKLEVWNSVLLDFSRKVIELEHIIAQAAVNTDGNITITEPTSSTAWYPGQPDVPILWNNGGLGGNVKIELYKGDQLNEVIKSSTFNSGNYSYWIVPETKEIGSDYQVKITSLTNSSKWSISDYFNIAQAGGNLPPNKPMNPRPENGASNQLNNLYLRWDCTDPNGDDITFDIYFGTSTNPPLVLTNTNYMFYNPGQLEYNNTYYWKIVARDSHGNERLGDIWNFSTEPDNLNHPPNPPFNPFPSNGASVQPPNVTLSWDCTDPENDQMNYDIYLGTVSDPPLLQSFHQQKSLQLNSLIPERQYFWKITARDINGRTTTGPIWSFYTNAMDWINIPAGDFTYGPDDNIENINYDYQIMRVPVTNSEYCAYLNSAYQQGNVTVSDNHWYVVGYYEGDDHVAAGYYNYYDLLGGSYHKIEFNDNTFYVVAGFGDHPVVHVTWIGAKAYAHANGWDLPTDMEWEKAARSNTGWDFPWGDTIDGSRANYLNSGDPWDNGTTPVGYFNGENGTTNSPSPYGVYDMCGNVWEWTKTYELYNSNNLIVRGGCWNNGLSNDALYLKTHYQKTDETYVFNGYERTGFRCVK